MTDALKRVDKPITGGIVENEMLGVVTEERRVHVPYLTRFRPIVPGTLSIQFGEDFLDERQCTRLAPRLGLDERNGEVRGLLGEGVALVDFDTGDIVIRTTRKMPVGTRVYVNYMYVQEIKR